MISSSPLLCGMHMRGRCYAKLPPHRRLCDLLALFSTNQQKQPSALAGPEYDREPRSIDVQNPWNIRALERPEPTTVEDCLFLVV